MAGTLQSLRTEFDPDLPLERAKTIPNTWYTSGEVRIWSVMPSSRDRGKWSAGVNWWRHPAQFLTANIGGEPLVIVRGDDGTLRAFFNVCRHKAGPLCTEECGTVTKLRCRYHGWTYDLAGNLRGLPEFDGVQNFAKEDNGLVPVAVAEWGPFVWVHLTPPREPVEQFLAPLPAWTASRSALNGLVWYARKSYDLACNWKVYVDNYLDGGYHVNTVHPALAGVLDYREYKTVPEGNTVLQSSPIKPGEGEAGRTRTGDIAAYWWVWPNFMMNVYAGVMDTNLVLPLGVDRCRVIFDFYFDPEMKNELKAREREGGRASTGRRYGRVRGSAAEPEQPQLHDWPVQREAREWWVLLSPDAGAGTP